MKQADADAWGQVFGDYEIMQPFSQLSREAIRPSDDEKVTTELTRVTGITVPTGKVLGLDNRGWRRGPPQDGGVVCWYEKPLSDDYVACLDLEPGIFTGMICGVAGAEARQARRIEERILVAKGELQEARRSVVDRIQRART